MKKNLKKLKYGSVAFTLTVVFVVGVILANVVFSLIGANSRLDFDMTSDRVYTMSAASESLLDSNTDGVTVYFLRERDKAMDVATLQYMINLVDSYYAKYSDKWLDVEYIDLIKNPTFKNKYTKSSSESLSENSIIVECEKNNEYKVLKQEDYLLLEIDSYYGYYNVVGFQGELALTSAILNVTNPDGLVATKTSNHGEENVTYLDKFLESVGYEIKSIDLENEDISEETSLLIINNPKYDFKGVTLGADTESASEIEKLVEYISTPEKNMMVFMGPTSPALKEFEEFLAVYGVSVTRAVAVDASNAAAGTEGMAIYGKYNAAEGSLAKEISDKMTSDNYKSFFYNSAPINIIFDQKSNIEVSPLATTSKTAYYNDESGNAVEGQLNLMTVTSVNNGTGSSCLVLCSTPMFTYFLETSTYANRDLMYAIVEEFGVVNISADVEIKNFDNSSFDITEDASRAWGIAITAVPALIVLTVGAIVWIKRRHL